ncbi:MAG TPA: tetratricopeptide repeat protein [Phycisphaerae bacterium]|nr:tetratricopeptide repeat protein [Phycisphaerae bacterium]
MNPGRQLLAALGLILLCLAAYCPLVHAGYIWDDDVWLTNNPLVQHWSGLWYIWFAPQSSTQYYPLVYTAFLLQFKLWGLNPFGFHLVNIGLQAINAILLWRILRLMGLKSAWVAAAVWAIHPVQVETVGWITEQKNLLSAALGFSAALLWIKWAGLDMVGSDATGKMPVPQKMGSGMSAERPPVSTGDCMSSVGHWKLLLPATILFVLALLAKTDICTLPAVLLLVAWWKRGGITRAEILSVIPWLLIGGLLASFTIYIEHGTAGAQGPPFTFSLSQRLIVAGKDFWFYPLKLFWPHPLLAVYPRWDVDHFVSADWLFPFVACAVPVILWLLRNKIGRGPFIAVAYYIITISPVLGFISFYTMLFTFVADHYQYLAGIGIIVLAVELAALGWERLWPILKKIEYEKNTRGLTFGGVRLLPMTAATALLLELGALSWGQSELYQSPKGIWENVIDYDHDSWFAWDQLGAYDFKSGDADDGRREVAQAYQITGDRNFYTVAILGYDLANVNRDYVRGILLLQQSLQLNPYQAYFSACLSSCYKNRGQINHALEVLDRGLELMPDNPTLNVPMGEILGSRGNDEAALEDFQKALSYKPFDPTCMFDDIIALRKLERYQDALNQCRQMLNIYPDNTAARILYGGLLLTVGRDQEAVDFLSGIVRSMPNSSDAHLALAEALEKTGDLRAAALQRAMARKLNAAAATEPTTSEPNFLP